MKHQEYVDVCERTELKDMPARLRNLKTGEIGEVVLCSGMDIPETFMVRVDQELTCWDPDEVEEVKE